MTPRSWTIDVSVEELKLAERFTIARASWDTTRNVFVRLTHGTTSGIGEVSPGDDAAERVADELRGVELDSLQGPFDLEGVGDLLPPGPARCALDIALHDLAARRAGITVAELLGLGGRSLPPTSVTVPIADVDRMVARARDLRDHPVLKMKVGFDGDVDAVRAVRAVYDGRLRLDANEGWDEASAVTRLRALEALDIELCEQPIPAGDRIALRTVTRSTSIPIFADESVCTAGDVAALAGAVYGVNLKLRKAGGIRATVHAIATARAVGLRTMVGCDLESGVAAAAQASVAALVEHADIDGPLLLADDPYPTVTYERGVVTPATGPGLGVRDVSS